MGKTILKNYRLWWHRPVSSSTNRQREVSFLELFYDLVYVVLIAEIAHHLATHLSWTSVFQFAFMFLFVIWAWINGMFYHDQHGGNDVSIRIFTFVQMILVGAMAVFAGDAFGDGADGFAVAFAIFELFFAFMWFRTGLYDKRHATISTPWSISHVFVAAAMLWSTQLPQPEQFYVWGVALAFSILSPLVFYIPKRFREVAETSLTLSPSSIERYGLLTIIVLGEVVVSSIRGTAELGNFTMRAGIILVFSMSVAFAFWWMYFDFISRRPVKDESRASLLYNYLHMPLLMCIAGAGAILLYIIEHSSNYLEDQTRWMFVMFVAIAVISISLIVRVVKYPKSIAEFIGGGAWIMFASALLILALGFTNLGVVGLITISLALMLVPVYYGIVSWIKTLIAENS